MYVESPPGDPQPQAARTSAQARLTSFTISDGTSGHRGREAITDYFARWDEAWAEFRVDAGRIDVARDEDLALLAARYRGRGKGSAVDVDGNFYTVWQLRDGKVLRCREYAHESEARAEFERRR